MKKFSIIDDITITTGKERSWNQVSYHPYNYLYYYRFHVYFTKGNCTNINIEEVEKEIRLITPLMFGRNEFIRDFRGYDISMMNDFINFTPK